MSPSLQGLGDLPLTVVARHLDTKSFGLLKCVCKSGVLPALSASSEVRRTMQARGTLPPPAVVEGWHETDWLLHAHTSEQTTDCPYEADAYNTYLGGYGPSQAKMLRLQHDAIVAWRRQGLLVAEYLEPKRKQRVPLRSLDFSALFFPPFPHLARATRGLPVEHVRFSTGNDPYETLPPMRLRELFEHTPTLRAFELTGQMHGVDWQNFDQDFEIDAFCVALADALNSPHAPELCELRLNFTRVQTPVRTSAKQALQRAVAKRTALKRVHIAWPK